MMRSRKIKRDDSIKIKTGSGSRKSRLNLSFRSAQRNPEWELEFGQAHRVTLPNIQRKNDMLKHKNKPNNTKYMYMFPNKYARKWHKLNYMQPYHWSICIKYSTICIGHETIVHIYQIIIC